MDASHAGSIAQDPAKLIFILVVLTLNNIGISRINMKKTRRSYDMKLQGGQSGGRQDPQPRARGNFTCSGHRGIHPGRGRRSCGNGAANSPAPIWEQGRTHLPRARRHGAGGTFLKPARPATSRPRSASSPSTLKGSANNKPSASFAASLENVKMADISLAELVGRRQPVSEPWNCARADGRRLSRYLCRPSGTGLARRKSRLQSHKMFRFAASSWGAFDFTCGWRTI
jgi:hypothetical protein